VSKKDIRHIIRKRIGLKEDGEVLTFHYIRGITPKSVTS